jgi:hypothetical protein
MASRPSFLGLFCLVFGFFKQRTGFGVTKTFHLVLERTAQRIRLGDGVWDTVVEE